ncbi:MAG: hypothetical protein VYE22_36260 [Myxococcota bacterium]|nr:hypothetical protein [Myxococcota bacterium]
MRALPLLLLLAFAAPAAAQEIGPQACGQEASSADYGEVRVGAEVVPQRHRFVGGDPNWDGRMGRYLGMPGRVTRLSGVDDQGCPGVRIDVDGGRWFWRLRDLNVGVARPGAELPEREASPIPQQCGRTDATVEYGPLQLGTVVVLGRHRPIGGDDNWTPQMTAFVGRTARVVELAGTDDTGCAGVHVDVDGRQWFWRIRDLSLSDDEGGAVAYRPGMASDHGRPIAPEEPPDARVPQQCGMTDETADFGPVTVGSEVVVGRHRSVMGEANWVEEMEAFVGRTARVTELVGVDEQGCALVHVDADNGEWFWRLRDMRLPEESPAPPTPSEPETPAPTPGTP